MSDPIDPEKLEEAITWIAGKTAFQNCQWRERVETIHAAARAHLATLPRFKEETFTRYLVVSDHEESGPYAELVDAAAAARCRRGAVVVTLTGTAKVRVKP